MLHGCLVDCPSVWLLLGGHLPAHSFRQPTQEKGQASCGITSHTKSGGICIGGVSQTYSGNKQLPHLHCYHWLWAQAHPNHLFSMSDSTFPSLSTVQLGGCRLLSETVRGMTHEDIISLARAAHGHPMKLTDLRQVGLLTCILTSTSLMGRLVCFVRMSVHLPELLTRLSPLHNTSHCWLTLNLDTATCCVASHLSIVCLQPACLHL